MQRVLKRKLKKQCLYNLKTVNQRLLQKQRLLRENGRHQQSNPVNQQHWRPRKLPKLLMNNKLTNMFNKKNSKLINLSKRNRWLHRVPIKIKLALILLKYQTQNHCNSKNFLSKKFWPIISYLSFIRVTRKRLKKYVL